MPFVVKRYLLGLKQRKGLFLLAFLPPLFYVVLLAMNPYSFSISQKVSGTKEAPVAVSTGPLEFQSLGAVIADGSFLRDSVARLEVGELDLSSRHSADELGRTTDNLSIKFQSAEVVLVSYEGENRELGSELVRFLAQYLVTKSVEGTLRATSRPRSLASEIGVRVDAPSVSLLGSLEILGRRAVWRAERTGTLVLVFLLSLLVLLILVGVLEWTDPSLKSERQVARYLGIPVLGSVSDFDEVCQQLDPRYRP